MRRQNTSQALIILTSPVTEIKDFEPVPSQWNSRRGTFDSRYSKIPVTLIEMGFLTNPQEDKLLNSEEYQDMLVKGMIDGIQEYFESPEAQD